MAFEIGQLSLNQAASPLAPRARADAAPAGARAVAVDASDIIPASPPPAVLAAVDAAWERAAQLAAENRELHFTRDETTGRIVVEVRTLDGEVVRTIPPSQALDVVGGAAL